MMGEGRDKNSSSLFCDLTSRNGGDVAGVEFSGPTRRLLTPDAIKLWLRYILQAQQQPMNKRGARLQGQREGFSFNMACVHAVILPTRSSGV
ncbi:MAG: hypothetical protein JWQ90_1798 [Hydrocarboniphaga sp.]|nr:hypothetical protein [Hydrocarboniphaga sp.]